MDFSLFDPAVSSASLKKSASNVRSRLSSPPKCYMLPSSATPADNMNLALLCVLACTDSGADISEWKNLLLTYTNCLLSNILGKLPKDSYKAQLLTAANVASIKEAVGRLGIATTAAETGNLDQGVAAPGLGLATIAWNLPYPDDAVPAGWSYYSGKQINSDNRSAITINRPRALIEKYQIGTTEILTGSTRISDYGHSMVYQAWLEMSPLRSACFMEFSNYFGSGTDLGQDIILTNVALMRFIQMNHASIIQKFLQAYPWAIEMEGLRQSVAVYAQNLEAAKKVSPPLRPFIKLIWGDKSGAFPRKELGPLIACALSTERETHSTLEKYYSDDRFASVVEAFRDEQSRRSRTLPVRRSADQRSENNEGEDGNTSGEEDGPTPPGDPPSQGAQHGHTTSGGDEMMVEI